MFLLQGCESKESSLFMLKVCLYFRFRKYFVAWNEKFNYLTLPFPYRYCLFMTIITATGYLRQDKHES